MVAAIGVIEPGGTMWRTGAVIILQILIVCSISKAAPVLPDSTRQDSTAVDSVGLPADSARTTARPMETVKQQAEQQQQTLLSIKRLLVKRLEAAETEKDSTGAENGRSAQARN